MTAESEEYGELPRDAAGIGQGEDRSEKSGAEQRAAMRRSEALVQSMEDAHWEELMGGSDGKGREG